MKSPYHLVLISESFIEARAALSRTGMTSLAPNQNPVKVDATSVPPVTVQPSTALPSGLSHDITFPPLFLVQPFHDIESYS